MNNQGTTSEQPGPFLKTARLGSDPSLRQKSHPCNEGHNCCRIQLENVSNPRIPGRASLNPVIWFYFFKFLIKILTSGFYCFQKFSPALRAGFYFQFFLLKIPLFSLVKLQKPEKVPKFFALRAGFIFSFSKFQLGVLLFQNLKLFFGSW